MDQYLDAARFLIDKGIGADVLRRALSKIRFEKRLSGSGCNRFTPVSFRGGPSSLGLQSPGDEAS